MQARYYDPVLGRFLSNDPVGFSVERPEYFNRYAYAGNDPVNAIDPDGKKIFILAVGADRVKISGALEKIENSNPKSAARMQELRDSPNTHIIRNTRGNEAPHNRTRGNGNNASNGVGTGSESAVDPEQSVMTTNDDGSRVTNSPETIITHELLGHGVDKDRGTLDRSTNPDTGEKRSEESAMAAENEYKDAVGETRRDRH